MSLTSGRAFGAWVDMREGDTFGATFTVELEPGVAVFVPRGVGNSYQTLEDGVAYTYLVNEHWRPGLDLPRPRPRRPDAAIAWPIPLDEAEVSDKDRAQPAARRRRADAAAAPARSSGSRGQLGRALTAAFPDAIGVDLDELDVTDPEAVAAWPWHEHDVVLNAAAYTAVDAAETAEGRVAAWAANAAAPAALARVADDHRLTLVHFSTEYVFDGTRSRPRRDRAAVAAWASTARPRRPATSPSARRERHYLLRTIVAHRRRPQLRAHHAAAGRATASRRRWCPTRWVGSPSPTSSPAPLATCSTSGAPFGTYHVSNGGDPMSWADVAASGLRPLRAATAPTSRDITTEAYAAGKAMAPRPLQSTLALDKLERHRVRARGRRRPRWSAYLDRRARRGS